jgi:tetratricopeptide (TPR) repeat protein
MRYALVVTPKLLSLADAAEQIAAATSPKPWRPKPDAPYFFIVGAGISFPSVPLARGIEELCRTAILEHGGTPPDAKSPMERYEKLFEAAFPHAEDRRAFLHHHIRSARISAANFRLAHILSSGQLANLVVTTNFDELLTKALRLFGRDVMVCDHPTTTQRFVPQNNDLQIIHVHGTHWFYDCCNLKDEIESRARIDPNDPIKLSGMSQLLDRVLSVRSPLVVGYSGWEGDVVMGALRRRLTQTLPLNYNLYWFCFKRTEVDALPEWLKLNASVRFVVPVVPADERVEISAAASVASVSSVESPSEVPGVTIESKRADATLPAHQVFDALIRELKLDQPELTKAPLSFFGALLTSLIAADELGEADPYLLRRVIRTVEDSAEMVRQAQERLIPTERRAASAGVERVSEAVRRASYRDAIDAGRRINVSALSEIEGLELDAALDAIYEGASEGQDLLAACELRLQLCETALARGQDELRWRVRWAMTAIRQGTVLSRLGAADSALVTYDGIVNVVGGRTEPALREQVADALYQRVLALVAMGRLLDALKSLNDIVQRSRGVGEGWAREIACKSLELVASIYAGIRRTDDALATLDEIEREFGRSQELSIAKHAGRALLSKGRLCLELSRRAEAVAIFDAVDQRYKGATEMELQRLAAWALLDKARVSAEDGRLDDAVSECDVLIDRVNGSSDSVLMCIWAMTLSDRGIAARKLRRFDLAMASFGEVERRFRGTTTKELRTELGRALFNKGMTLVVAGRMVESVEVFMGVVHEFGNDVDRVSRLYVAQSYLELGLAYRDINSVSQSLAAFDRVVNIFGHEKDSYFMKLVAESIFNKGELLEARGAIAQAIAEYGEIEKRFASAPDVKLAKFVADARERLRAIAA